MKRSGFARLLSLFAAAAIIVAGAAAGCGGGGGYGDPNGPDSTQAAPAPGN